MLRSTSQRLALSAAAVAIGLGVPTARAKEYRPDPGQFPAPLKMERREMLAAMRAAIYPDGLPVPTPEYKITSKEDCGDYFRWKVEYAVETDERVNGWLLIPKPAPAQGEKLPLILALHPTNNTGKDRTVGIYESEAATPLEAAKRANREYGLDLVRQGFVVFTPDRLAYGERGGSAIAARERMNEQQKVLLAKHPGWSLTGKAIWDLSRALDFLVTLDFVDPRRIGSVGHSLGAWDTVLLGALDERVGAVAVSHCGSLRYRPEYWTNEETLKAYLQKNRERFVGLNQNLNVYLMLLAPRPQLFFWSIREPKDEPPNLLDALRLVSNYNLHIAQQAGTPFAFSFYLHTEGHDFPSDSRALAWQWFKNHLKPEQRHSTAATPSLTGETDE